ncbi:MAG: hypothetical protein AAF253_00440 [Pseudomonadota bacterium]
MKDPIMMDGTGPSGPTNAQLDAIRQAGQWMPWAGLGLAIVWWASVAVTVVTSVDPAQFSEASALSVMAAIALAAVPGLVVLFAGYVAREGARRNAASNLILKAATQLLNPSKAYGEEAQTLAASLKASSDEIDQAMETALSAMKSVSSEMGDERMRLESVTYAAADNARDLASRLADERAALETLTHDLREQADTMGETIPRQAAMMVDAARSASIDMAKSDEALEQRLQSLKRTGTQITEEFAKIDGMAHTLEKQSDTLVFAVSRLETQLAEAQQTVSDAMRAGDVASDAAGETGEALTRAVNGALEHARRLNAEINASARQASDEANRAMAELRYAAEQTAAAVGQASRVAQKDGGLSDQQLGQVAEALSHAAGQSSRAASAADTLRHADTNAVTDAPAQDPAVQAPALRAPSSHAPAPGARPASRPGAGSEEQPSRRGIPRAISPADTPVTEAARQALNGRSGLNGQGRPPARPEPDPAPQSSPSTQAAAPKPVLPPPAPERPAPGQPQQSVTLTSTRSAGFAQPNAHVAMPANLDAPRALAGTPDETPAAPSRPNSAPSRPPRPTPTPPAAGEPAPPRASLGGAPVPVAPAAANRPARASEPAPAIARPPQTPSRPHTPAAGTGSTGAKAPRSVPRLDASPRELEAELFGGDDLGAPHAPAESEWPDPRTEDPIVDDNIFHANPRDAGLANGAASEARPAPAANGAEPRHKNGSDRAERRFLDRLAPRDTTPEARRETQPAAPRPDATARAAQDGRNVNGHGVNGHGHAPPAPGDRVGPPPANVDVQPSLQNGSPAPAPSPAPNPAPTEARTSPAAPSPAASAPAAPASPDPLAGDAKRDADWSTILNDMDREETGQLPREETAESVIQRLETSGIALSNIFRPKAKKKIAAAARKGEQSRRAAIVSAARTEVDRVAKRLVADPELAQLADDFVAMEEPDAIAALDRTQKSGRNASPRLSAFLLLDAATSNQSAPH